VHARTDKVRADCVRCQDLHAIAGAQDSSGGHPIEELAHPALRDREQELEGGLLGARLLEPAPERLCQRGD
jgi:hypothetical protein